MRIRPRIIPDTAPPKNPLQVFPSPKILFPFQVFPKSMGVPPPNTAAMEFGSIAGRKSHNPRTMITRTSMTDISNVTLSGTSDKSFLDFAVGDLSFAEEIPYRDARIVRQFGIESVYRSYATVENH